MPQKTREGRESGSGRNSPSRRNRRDAVRERGSAWEAKLRGDSVGIQFKERGDMLENVYIADLYEYVSFLASCMGRSRTFQTVVKSESKSESKCKPVRSKGAWEPRKSRVTDAEG
jgi:hypothetical protein